MNKASICVLLCLAANATAGDSKADVATAKAFIASLELGPTLQNGDITPNGPRRKESLLSWDDGYNPVSMHMAAPWVTR